jgi:hypothetical protein
MPCSLAEHAGKVAHEGLSQSAGLSVRLGRSRRFVVNQSKTRKLKAITMTAFKYHRLDKNNVLALGDAAKHFNLPNYRCLIHSYLAQQKGK